MIKAPGEATPGKDGERLKERERGGEREPRHAREVTWKESLTRRIALHRARTDRAHRGALPCACAVVVRCWWCFSEQETAAGGLACMGCQSNSLPRFGITYAGPYWHVRLSRTNPPSAPLSTVETGGLFRHARSLTRYSDSFSLESRSPWKAPVTHPGPECAVSTPQARQQSLARIVSRQTSLVSRSLSYSVCIACIVHICFSPLVGLSLLRSTRNNPVGISSNSSPEVSSLLSRCRSTAHEEEKDDPPPPSYPLHVAVNYLGFARLR